MIARNRTRTVLTLVAVTMAIVGLATTSASGDAVLRVDFNSNQDGGGDSTTAGDPSLSAANHNQEGWSSYHANHEVIAEFTTADYDGITVTPDWPNTTDRRVRQSIDRSNNQNVPPTGNDGNWDDAAGDLNLVTDFIGIDTRTGNGGNGNWDGTTGTPTYMTLALGGLGAGYYDWTSFHHDTEHVHGPFAVWISTDGGATFEQLDDGVMTDSTPAGSPDSGATEVGPDANTLSSTYHTSFRADGVHDVVLRFAPYSDAAGAHRQIWGTNGFVLSGGAGRPLARLESPANGAMIEATGTVLGWRAGDFAASHNVYFGDDFDDVNQATAEDDAFQGNQSEVEFSVQDLTPGATYYWRVDEVNDLDPNSPWKGDVWNFWIEPATAWNPSPADGLRYVLPEQDLSWNAGMGALYHTVYFGESYEEVRDMVDGHWMIPDPVASPAENYGPLQPNTTYYWRVDEFAMIAGFQSATYTGEVWSFTTLPEVAVSDPTLVGWWTLDEGEGTTAVDWSGNGHHGTIAGTPQWEPDGMDRGSLVLDGRDNYIAIEGMMDSGVVLAEYTMAVWFRADRKGGDRDLIAAYSSGPTFGVLVEFKPDGTMRFLHRSTTGGTGADLLTTDSYDDGAWHHVAVVKTAGELIGYIDGEVAVSEVTDDAFDGSFYVALGVLDHLRGADRLFPGPLDDARIYDRALDEAEIQQIMRGDPTLAADPNPTRDAVVDIRDATFLNWSAGDGAVSHNVYLGTDRDATAAAGPDAAEYQGNQPGTSLSLAGLVEVGGGDYYWRIDEVQADGAVAAGNIWKFTVPDYLVVDNFESYTNDSPNRVFQTWVDGGGFSADEFFPAGNPGNGTGAIAGHDIWTPGTPYTTIMETASVNSGAQAFPIYYTGLSEVIRTFAPAENWTVEDVTTLVVHFRGEPDNTGTLYIKINGVEKEYDGDPAGIASTQWILWPIDLSTVGTSVTSVTTLTIGIKNGDTGIVYVDDIWLTKP